MQETTRAAETIDFQFDPDLNLIQAIAEGELTEEAISRFAEEILDEEGIDRGFRVLLDCSAITGTSASGFGALLPAGAARRDKLRDVRIAIVIAESRGLALAKEFEASARGQAMVFCSIDVARAWLGCEPPKAFQEMSRALEEFLLRFGGDLPGTDRDTDHAPLAKAMFKGRTYCLVRLPQATRFEHLTMKQKEIVLLVAQGLTNKQIASKLGVAPATVASHLSRIFRKYHVDSRSALVGSTLGGFAEGS